MGIIQLHVMETDLTSLLVRMPTVERYSSEGAVDPSICAERALHGAL